MLKNKKFMFLGLIGVFMFTVLFTASSAFAQVSVYSQISGNETLKVGSRSGDVSTLQKFMASNKDIYPAGLITGYFGPMTKNAVMQFQLAYDLTSDGIVGPMTKATVNNVIVAGRGIDIYAPAINNLAVSVSGKNATFTFNSNESIKATLFYSTNAISWKDSGRSFGIPTISGTTSVDNAFSSSKQFSLSNLSANARYYYTVMATDASGNISVVWPRTFTTGQ